MHFSKLRIVGLLCISTAITTCLYYKSAVDIVGMKSFTIETIARIRTEEATGLDTSTVPPQCTEFIPSFEDAVAEQFTHIMRRSPNFSRVSRPPSAIERQFKTYTHNISAGAGCIQNNMDYLQLTIIEEQSPGKLSHGGSAFMVRVQHVYLVVCPVKDYFNGTYTIFCPMYGQICANVSVLIKHIDFLGFNGRTLVLEKMIWEDKVCSYRDGELDPMSVPHIPTINATNLSNNDPALKSFLSNLPSPQTHGHWLKYQGQWKWVGSQGQLLPLERNATMCKCFERFHTSYFMGASHMFINRDCLGNLCKNAKLQRVPASLVKEIIPKLTEIFAELQNDTDASHVYQIVLQMGSWDLNKHDFKDVMEIWIPKLQSAILDLTRKHSALVKSERVKLLVMSSPSLPDADRIGMTIGPHVSRVVDRNNWISAVLASTLRKHVEAVPGVEFLSEFEFTFPLYWNVFSWPRFPNHHYSMWNGKLKRCPGHVGNAFLGRIAAKLCPDVHMV